MVCESCRPLLVAECHVQLSKGSCKPYCVRYRVCQQHMDATEVVLEGVASRFCQQCGRFQTLADFDGPKRSCRWRLQHHNINRQQRRKEKAQQRALLECQPQQQQQQCQKLPQKLQQKQKRKQHGFAPPQAAAETQDTAETKSAGAVTGSAGTHTFASAEQSSPAKAKKQCSIESASIRSTQVTDAADNLTPQSDNINTSFKQVPPAKHAQSNGKQRALLQQPLRQQLALVQQDSPSGQALQGTQDPPQQQQQQPQAREVQCYQQHPLQQQQQPAHTDPVCSGQQLAFIAQQGGLDRPPAPTSMAANAAANVNISCKKSLSCAAAEPARTRCSVRVNGKQHAEKSAAAAATTISVEDNTAGLLLAGMSPSTAAPTGTMLAPDSLLHARVAGAAECRPRALHLIPQSSRAELPAANGNTECIARQQLPGRVGSHQTEPVQTPPSAQPIIEAAEAAVTASLGLLQTVMAQASQSDTNNLQPQHSMALAAAAAAAAAAAQAHAAMQSVLGVVAAQSEQQTQLPLLNDQLLQDVRESEDADNSQTDQHQPQQRSTSCPTPGQMSLTAHQSAYSRESYGLLPEYSSSFHGLHKRLALVDTGGMSISGNARSLPCSQDQSKREPWVTSGQEPRALENHSVATLEPSLALAPASAGTGHTDSGTEQEPVSIGSLQSPTNGHQTFASEDAEMLADGHSSSCVADRLLGLAAGAQQGVLPEACMLQAEQDAATPQPTAAELPPAEVNSQHVAAGAAIPAVAGSEQRKILQELVSVGSKAAAVTGLSTILEQTPDLQQQQQQRSASDVLVLDPASSLQHGGAPSWQHSEQQSTQNALTSNATLQVPNLVGASLLKAAGRDIDNSQKDTQAGSAEWLGQQAKLIEPTSTLEPAIVAHDGAFDAASMPSTTSVKGLSCASNLPSDIVPAAGSLIHRDCVIDASCITRAGTAISKVAAAGSTKPETSDRAMMDLLCRWAQEDDDNDELTDEMMAYVTAGLL